MPGRLCFRSRPVRNPRNNAIWIVDFALRRPYTLVLRALQFRAGTNNTSLGERPGVSHMSDEPESRTDWFAAANAMPMSLFWHGAKRDGFADTDAGLSDRA